MTAASRAAAAAAAGTPDTTHRGQLQHNPRQPAHQHHYRHFVSPVRTNLTAVSPSTINSNNGNGNSAANTDTDGVHNHAPASQGTCAGEHAAPLGPPPAQPAPPSSAADGTGARRLPPLPMPTGGVKPKPVVVVSRGAREGRAAVAAGVVVGVVGVLVGW